jgi:hypothetical protein
VFALHKTREIPEFPAHTNCMLSTTFLYIVVLSVSMCQKKIKKCPNNKKEIYNDKYRHTRDVLFGLDKG